MRLHPEMRDLLGDVWWTLKGRAAKAGMNTSQFVTRYTLKTSLPCIWC